MKKYFNFFGLSLGFISIFVLQENSLAAPSFVLNTAAKEISSPFPTQFSLSNPWSKTWSSASIENWRARLRLVATKLAPDYQSSTGPFCTVAGIQPSPSNSLESELFYYSLSQKLPSFSIKIVPSEAVSAIALDELSSETGENTVILTTELLSHITSPTELAFVLAHELAHLELGHNTTTLPRGIFTDTQLRHIQKTHQNWELSADLAALAALKKSGYETAEIYNLLNRLALHEKRSDPELLHSHPTITARIEALVRGSVSNEQTARLIN